MDKEIIKEILRIAVNTPSGHNSQPWRFTIKENTISTWNIPDKDKTLFNYQQRGSFIAHGALIENIVIISSAKGYEAKVILFPQPGELNLIANISLEKNNKVYPYQHLSSFIPKRATNRKPYRKVPFGASEQKKLKEFSDVILLQEEENIRFAARVFSVADKLLFENFYLHKALFNNVNWTLKEERQKKEGLYVGTKELSFSEKVVFRYLISNWSILTKLNKIGFSEKAARKRQKLYEQCSAIGLLVAPDDSPNAFVESGRILQRFWLTATSLGLSFQPVSVGLLYLGQWLKKEFPSQLSHQQGVVVERSYQKILDIFNVLDKTPVFSFRIGYSNPPSAVSLKKPPLITYYDS